MEATAWSALALRQDAAVAKAAALFLAKNQNKDGGYQVRLYHHPFVPWIWLGGLIMALGGFVSLSDRRWRVGIARRKSAAMPVAAE